MYESSLNLACLKNILLLCVSCQKFLVFLLLLSDTCLRECLAMETDTNTPLLCIISLPPSSHSCGGSGPPSTVGKTSLKED